MRQIKFQFLYKGLPFTSKNDKFCWHKKVYTLDQLIKKSLRELSDVHDICELVAKRQFTGLQDKNGVDIYEGDIVSRRINCLWDEGRQNDEVGFQGCGFTSGDGCLQNIVDSFDAEIIGNIHESPKLLEQDNEQR